MPFTQTDFDNIETRTKLITIMNDSIGIPPLTKISTLTKRQLLIMNAKMNDYIKNLPERQVGSNCIFGLDIIDW